MARKGIPLHGWLIVDKPLGQSSAQIVEQVKRLTNAAKVGHAGTLDPLASGVLPLAFGEATKTVPYIMDGTKHYRFTVAWGVSTNTDDAEGRIVEMSSVRPHPAAIAEILPRYLGRINQVPPSFSAIKLDGARAYDLARRGVSVELSARPVQIDSITLLECAEESARFEVICGKGTYIRSLGRDMARDLGTVGHISALRRLAVGRFDESSAIPLDSIVAMGHSGEINLRLLPLITALDDIPALAVTADEAKNIRAGQAVPLTLTRVIDAEPLIDRGIICAVHGDQAVAIGRVSHGLFKPARVFNL